MSYKAIVVMYTVKRTSAFAGHVGWRHMVKSTGYCELCERKCKHSMICSSCRAPFLPGHSEETAVMVEDTPEMKSNGACGTILGF